jgi:predicted transposase YbfD/YdcC
MPANQTKKSTPQFTFDLCETIAPEIMRLREALAALPDSRMPGRVLHPLDEVLTTAFIAVCSGADCFTDMGDFARTNLPWLRKFLPLKFGAPSHDVFRNVFCMVRPAGFEPLLDQWAASLPNLAKQSPTDPEGTAQTAPAGNSGKPRRIIRIDGKSLRGSDSAAAGLPMIHLLRAWVEGSGISVRHIDCSEKSNELANLPALLESLDLEGTLTTMDAAGTYPETAAKIIAGGGDYILALKKNQPEAYAQVESRFGQFDAFREKHDQAPSLVVEFHEVDYSHGRYCERLVEVTPVGPEAGDWFKKDWKWDRLASVIRVTRRTHRGGKQGEELTKEVHYALSSLPPTPTEQAQGIRGHWGVENTCHHVLDVTFNEDHCQVRDRNAAVNLTSFREMAAKALRDFRPKLSIRRKRKLAGYDSDFREELLSHAFHNFNA